MAREFAGASSQYLSNASAVVTAYPFTFAAWTRATTVASLQEVIGIGGTADSNAVSVGFDASGHIRAFVTNSGTSGIAATSTTASNGVWCHAAGVFTNATSRAAFLNGAGKGTNATNLNFPAFTSQSLSVARRQISAPDNYLTGAVAEAAIWSVALDDAEVASLAAGFSPLLIRPASLVGYWNLFGNLSPELDRWKNSYSLTLNAAPTKSVDHSRAIYPHQIASYI